MSVSRSTVSSLLVLLLSVVCSPVQASENPVPGSEVRVVQASDGSFVLTRNGEPYEVKGAGLGTGDLGVLKAAGGNSVRTWGIEQLEQQFDGKPLLDRAQELGITVSVGLWVAHTRHGFDYGDDSQVERQREWIREAVMRYRNHPALLTWSLGNEAEAFGQADADDRIWQELNHLAGMIKELDPHHPVMTVIAASSQTEMTRHLADIDQHYPNLDILGVNAYAAASGVGQNLPGQGWDGPYLLTEFGVAGTWEVRKTAWGAPIESDPSTKAADSYTVYQTDRERNAGRRLGSYVFLWGDKQETTSTWFGMFLPTGEKLPRVDAMAYAWSGQWPDNRAPKLRSLQTPVALKTVDASTSFHAEADIFDREGDALQYVWEIRAESTDRRIGGDAEAAPPSFPDAIKTGQGTERIEFRTPKRAGAYRLFVTAYDGQGGAVSHNLPFFVDD